MAIVIKNEWNKNIADIQALGSRCMYVTFKGTMETSLICVYQHTAYAPREHKEAVLKSVEKLAHNLSRKGPTYISVATLMPD